MSTNNATNSTQPLPATRRYVDGLKQAYAKMPIFPLSLLIDNPCFIDDGVAYTLEPYLDELRAFEQEIKAKKADPNYETNRTSSLIDELLEGLFSGPSKLDKINGAVTGGLKALLKKADKLEQDSAEPKNVTITCAVIGVGGAEYQIQVSLVAQPELSVEPGVIALTRGTMVSYGESKADSVEVKHV